MGKLIFGAVAVVCGWALVESGAKEIERKRRRMRELESENYRLRHDVGDQAWELTSRDAEIEKLRAELSEAKKTA